jgi:hypothetical protein
MNPETHVTSLEISKKLFEIGVKQESVWGLHWVLNEYCNINGVETFNSMMLTHDVIGKNSDTKYKALLASEIMDMLPDRITLLSDKHIPHSSFRFNLFRSFVVEEDMKIFPTFIVNYISDTVETTGKSAFLEQRLFHNIWDKTLPDALAKTLIYIKEHKLDELPYIPPNMGDVKQ